MFIKRFHDAPKRRAAIAVSMALGLLALGCGPSDGLTVYPVQGMVTFEGEPLEGAIVVFLPDESGRAASGRTLSDGSFQLATSGAQQSGAMAGDYHVTIRKEVDVDANGNPIDYGNGDAGPASKPQTRGKTISVIPNRYGEVEKTDLTATVTKGNNLFTFELTK